MPEEVAWPSPAHQINAALYDAAHGQMPSFTGEELLTTLGLERSTPDGLQFLERFVGPAPDRAARDILVLQGGIATLIEAANERTTTEAQEALAHMLGTVVTTHLKREGEVCLAIRDLILVNEREDIVPADVKRSLGGDDPQQVTLAQGRAMRLRMFRDFSKHREERP
ncbi:MAG TPA: hypothetical protein VLF62_03320 [Candidatus Saccharimonadales bacterium]|nr:hypothetical protein [Candidatus Saccharimonadales bacterium]